jgi:hypothetical protein
MANGFKDHRKLRVNWRQQGEALSEASPVEFEFLWFAANRKKSSQTSPADILYHHNHNLDQKGSNVWDDTLRCNAKTRSALKESRYLSRKTAHFGFGSVNSQQQFGSR